MKRHEHITAPARCSARELDALHQYLDGELPFSRQPKMFKHLSDCDDCRRMMDSVMYFRRMSRQEYLALPPSADEVFFERLARLKERGDRIDRERDRKPLWDSSRAVTLRLALMMAAAVFLIGLFVPMPSRTEYVTPLIQLELERVKFRPLQTAIYILPEIEVTAEKEVASSVLESF